MKRAVWGEAKTECCSLRRVVWCQRTDVLSSLHRCWWWRQQCSEPAIVCSAEQEVCFCATGDGQFQEDLCDCATQEQFWNQTVGSALTGLALGTPDEIRDITIDLIKTNPLSVLTTLSIP